jgi:ubiquinone/menaquinone biosynthesis C-methylase UbiE
MDPERFSSIGHTGIAFWNPVSETVLDQVVANLPLTTSSKVLDVGCGTAELLVRTVEKFGCSGLGLDKSEFAIRAAQQKMNCRLPQAKLDLQCQSFDAKTLAEQSFDLAICIGSTHAILNLEQSLVVLSRLVKPGGLILLGDGYWRTDPPMEYLDFLQCESSDLLAHQGNIDLAEKHSLSVMLSHKTTTAEWEKYEDSYAENILNFIKDHPKDPDVGAMKERILPWRDAYLKWGKDSLGFALYLLQKPATTE